MTFSPADLADRAARIGSDGLDLLTDFLGGVGRLLGKFFYFIGHHGKALAGVAGTSSLNGCVQGEQVRLLSDRRNDFNHLADFDAAQS